MAFKDSMKSFFGHYDKILAFLILVALIGSLVYLAVKIGGERAMQERFEQELGRVRPDHEHADEVDVDRFRRAVRSIQEPSTVRYSAWARMMFVPEARVWCVDCLRPIPVRIAEEEGHCPFCNALQPPPPEPVYDTDGDGMPDEWELTYGLNPYDPSDAHLDLDGDGFTNLEEFLAGTDPTDPDDFPPLVVKLRVLEITRDPFILRFQGVQRMGEDNLRFQLNLRDHGRSWFARPGEVVEGFKVVKFERKTERRQTTVGERDIDVSVLTLQRGDKLIPLVRGQDVQHDEFTATLILTTNNQEFQVKVRETLELPDGKKYGVLNIDTENSRVTIVDLANRKQTVVASVSAMDPPEQENIAAEDEPF